MGGDRQDRPGSGEPGSARPADDRAGAHLGQRRRGPARRATRRARLRRVLPRRRDPLLGQLHPARRGGAAAGGGQLHGLERAQPRPVPRAPGSTWLRGAEGHGASDARLRRSDRGRLTRREGRPRPAREPRRTGRHRADRVSGALPSGRRPASSRGRSQPVSRQPAAGVSRGRAGGSRGDHGAQPRPARELPAGRLRRQRAHLADRVRLAHGAAARARRDHSGTPGRPRRAVRRPRAGPLPLRADARLVPPARRLADELLAQRPGRLRQPQEAGVRDLGAPRARERCRDATVPEHAGSLDRHCRRRDPPAVAGIRLQPARAAAQRGRAGLLGHRRAAQAPRRSDPEPRRDREGLCGARERGLRAGGRGAGPGARGARRGTGGQRGRTDDVGPDRPLRDRRGVSRAAGLGELPAPPGGAQRHRGQDRRGAPLLQHHGAPVQLAHPERPDEHHRARRRLPEREFFRIEDDADRAPVAVNLS